MIDGEGDGEGGGEDGEREGDGEGEDEREDERARVSFSEEDVLPKRTPTVVKNRTKNDSREV